MPRSVPSLQVQLRLATSDDVDALVSLVESAYRGDASRAGWTTEADLVGGRRTDSAEVAAALADPARRLLVAESEGGIVGCCQLSSRADGTAYLGMLAVRPDLQGRDVGSTLMAEAERRAATEWGARAVTMLVIGLRTELIEWYRRLGYRPTGATEPFPLDGHGRPLRPDIVFVVVEKQLR